MRFFVAALAAFALALATPAAAAGYAGDFDTTFGAGGAQFLTTGCESASVADSYDFAQAPDGDLLMTVPRLCGTAADSGVFLMRRTPAGALDASFGGGTGAVRVTDQRYARLAVQPDGRILTAHHLPSTGQSFVSRYLSNGELDTSFGTGGRVAVPAATRGRVAYQRAAVTGAPGRVLYLHDGGIFALRQSDGAIDTTFAGDGQDDLVVESHRSRLLVDVNRRIVLTSGIDALVLRRAPNGGPDTGFSGDGAATTPIVFHGNAAATTPEGGVAVAGSPPETNLVKVARLRQDGSVDTGYGDGSGTGGVGTVAFEDAAAAGVRDIGHVVVQPDGRVIVAGTWHRPQDGFEYYNQIWAFARLTPQGTADPSFGRTDPSATGDGTIRHEVGDASSVGRFHMGISGLALRGTRLIVAGKTYRNPGPLHTAVLGALDATYPLPYSTVSVTSTGRLTYTAPARTANEVRLRPARDGTEAVELADADQVDLVAGDGCQRLAHATVRCTGVSEAAIDTGDGGDRVTNTTALPMTVAAGDGADAVQGGTGADRFDGGSGPDSFWGGDGTDTASYLARGARVVVSLDGRANDGEAGEQDLIAGDVENLLGGGGNDSLIGNDGPDLLDGGGGNDVLDGRQGSDTLAGGPAVDGVTYAAHTGAVRVVLDTARNDGAIDVDPDTAGNQGEADYVRPDVENASGGPGPDELVGNASVNVLDGLGGDDLLDGRLGGDTLTGGAGIDTASYGARSTAVRVALDTLRNDGAIDVDPAVTGDQAEGDYIAPSVENATGGSGADVLTAVAANAVVNVLTGGLGPDRITTREGTATADRAVCGGGTDTAVTDASDERSLCEVSG